MMRPRIYVGIVPKPMPCADCGIEIITTYRPIAGKVFRCPACRRVHLAAKQKARRAAK